MTQQPHPLTVSEQAEIEDLYLKEASRLFQRAIVQTQGRRQEAEDAVHEVFIRVATKWETVGVLADSQRRAYLFKILERWVIDQWRRKKRRPEDLCEPEENADTGEDAYDVQLDAIARENLWQQLKSLSRQQYRVLYLSWELGWSTAMIAEYLSIRESTVRVHQSTAIASIRHSGVDLRSLGVIDRQREV